MKRWLPVLVLSAGLGSLISCKHAAPSATKIMRASSSVGKAASPPARIGKPSTKLNPFDRYLTDTKANWPEPALVRFAGECQVDLDSTVPRYAQNAGKKWLVVKDLSHALEDQETDFYHTAAVWHSQDRVLAEVWGMELDSGDYYRLLYCVKGEKITFVDSVSWSISLENDSSKDTGWGFEHQWKLQPDGEFATASSRFVDLREQPISAPKLDADTQKGLDEESVGRHTWADLELPNRLLH